MYDHSTGKVDKSRLIGSLRNSGKHPKSQHSLHFLAGHQENENTLHLT